MGSADRKQTKKPRSGNRVTMAAVGRMAGVSQVTVSRALSDPGKVSAATLQRIHQAIEATGFVPDANAGALASQRSLLVSALIPSLTNIVYASFVTPFSARMRAAGFQVLLSETGFDPDEEERLIQTHLSRRPDAMLLTGTRHSTRSRRMLLGAEIPVVEAWDLTDAPIDLCVGFSHDEAGRAVASWLSGQGFQRAATVTANDERAHRRRDAFRRRFEESSGQVLAHDCPGPASIAAGRQALSALLDKGNLSHCCLFCSSDVLALGVMIEAHHRGLSIPDEIALVGFGDQDFAADLSPPLTTIRVDREQLGTRAADAIIQGIDDVTARQHYPDGRIDIGFELIERGTTRSANTVEAVAGR